MRADTTTLAAILLACALMCGCGKSGGTLGGGTPPAPPSISTTTGGQTGTQNGAVIMSLSAASGTIYYTLDGSAPTTSSQQYQAPFLVASNLTVNAIAVSAGMSSTVTSEAFSPNIASNTLVWSEEFTSTGTPSQPNPALWTYDTGTDCCGNNDLETYCAWGSNSSPCSSASPSEFVGANDGYLHIVAQNPGSNVYTSARLKTQGLFSFQYGRLEFRAAVPEAQGFWPAAWLLGNNIATVNWPACGEQDVLERVNAALNPDWNEGSVHGPGFTGQTGLGVTYNFPVGQTASQFHTYGMAWAKGTVTYYVDGNPYATFNTGSLNGLSGAVWPFDAGQSNFILLNLAIGGDFPGPPDGTTPFPSEMLVDYVRIYTN
jgi:beta-glucanase (GH16 family)